MQTSKKISEMLILFDLIKLRSAITGRADLPAASKKWLWKVLLEWQGSYV